MNSIKKMAGYKKNNFQRGRNRYDPIGGNSRGSGGYNQRDVYERPYEYYDDPRRYDDYEYRRYPEYKNYDRGYDDWELSSRSRYDFAPRVNEGRAESNLDFRGNEGRTESNFGFRGNEEGTDSLSENARIKVVLKKPDKYTKDNAIFVTNIPIEYCRFKQREIMKQFEKCGNIIQKVNFPQNSPMGNNKAGVVMVFETSEQAQTAIKELDGYVFGSEAESKSEPIEKRETKPVPTVSTNGISCSLKKPDKYTKDNAVFVRHIPQELCLYHKKRVLAEFDKYGKVIQKVTFAKDGASGMYRGTIVVIYENNEQAKAAIKAMDGYVFEENPEPEKETIILKDDDKEPILPLNVTVSESETGLRVRNIPSFCKTDDVMKLFEKHGQISFDINLIDDPASDVGTLTCLIIYQRQEDGKIAMEGLNGYVFDKSQVFVPAMPIFVKFRNMSKGKKSKEHGFLQVSNIPKSYGIKELEKLFSKYGKLNQKINMPRDKFTGESRGISHVSFEKVNEAKAAKEALDGAKIEVSKEEYYDYYYGTDTARELYERISVKQCTTESHGKTIYLAGIPLYFTEWKANEAVKKAFSKFGKVILAELPRDKRTGDIRGIGYITFETKEEADSAIANMNDKLVTEAFSSNDAFQQKQYDYYQQPKQPDYYNRSGDPYNDYNWDRRTSSTNVTQGDPLSALSALSEPVKRGQSDPQQHGPSDPALHAPSDLPLRATAPADTALRASDSMSFLAAPADPMAFLTMPAAPKSDKASAGPSATPASTSSQKDGDYGTVVNALTSLRNVFSYLPILGPSLREALNAAVEQNQDANGVLTFFQAKDTHGLLDLVLVKLGNLQKNKSNKDNRQVDLFTDAIKCIGVLQGTIELPKSEETSTNVEESYSKSQGDYNNSEGNYYKTEGDYYKSEENYNSYSEGKYGNYGNYGQSEENHGNSTGNRGNSEGNYGNSEGNYGKTEENYGNMETNYSNENYNNSQENYTEYDEGDYRHTDENYRNW